MLTSITAHPIVADGRWHDGGPPPGAIILFVVMLLTLVVAAAAVIYTWSRRRRPDEVGSARAVLADRFARGEIDADEYRSRLTELDAS